MRLGTLYIAAKAPEPGHAKTRLAASIGTRHALALYRAFLHDLAARFAGAPFAVRWYVAPGERAAEVGALVGADDPEPQPEGDWTHRQRELFRRAHARGERRVVLIASDSPHLGVESVAHAFGLLGRHHVVLGRVDDGGYHLIGMRGFHDVFAGVEMSTPTVASELARRAAGLGASVGWTAPTFDVDEAPDLERLRAVVAARRDLPATRAALEALAVAPSCSA